VSDDFVGFDTTVFASSAFATSTPAPAPATTPAPETGSATPAPVGSNFFGFSLGALKGPVGLALLLLFSALGGAILNLTPCVLPVIPIKVMTLTRHAGTPGKSLYLGFWMALGVIAFWVAIGLPVALLNFGDPSRIFGYWFVTFGIGVLIAIMSLGLMGLFTLTLPQRVYMVNPNAENAPGSFLFGMMTAVLGLPCFGFVAGALLAAATKWGAATTLGVFAAIGVGMAAPYFILSARPSLLKAVPKTGPASELVKQVMGLLLLAAGAYFIGSGLIGLVAEQPWIAKQLHWWAVAVFATMAGVWLMVRTAQISKKPVPTMVFALVGVVMAGVAVLYARQSTAAARINFLERVAAADDDATLTPGTWVEYTPARFAAAKSADMVVVLDFTAEWCLNCKALKAAVLNREPVKPLLHDGAIALLTVDLTSRTAPGWDLLKSLGQTGIPLLVIYGPGLPPDQPWMSNAYTPDQVTQAVAKARGPGAGDSRLSATP
jgi:thiol:disulfide interchange protein